VDLSPSGAAAHHPAVPLAALAPGDAEPRVAARAARSSARRVDATMLRAGLFQVVVLLWGYALYDALRAGATGSRAAALAHAHQVTAIESVLGLHAERLIQRAALSWPWLVSACNLCYTLTHLAVPPLVLWLLYRHAPARYRQWRNAFLVLLTIGVLCFWLFPTGPPRLMPGSGVVDASHGYLSVGHTPVAGVSSSGGTAIAGTNPYAAMPSLHVAWAVWGALALGSMLRRRTTRLLVALYPAAMFAAVIVTGNHWALDAIAGVATALLAWGIVTVVTSAWQRRSTTGYRPL
jgi:PAP2 superfamily